MFERASYIDSKYGNGQLRQTVHDSAIHIYRNEKDLWCRRDPASSVSETKPGAPSTYTSNANDGQEIEGGGTIRKRNGTFLGGN